MVFLLVCFIQNFSVLDFISEKGFIKISGRTMNFCKFVNIYRLHFYFDYFKILKENMPKFMVKVIDINYILECSRFKEYIILS